ncbi:MAG: GNAT family N-acetyltransferase [Candidatus Kapabacteria bacterium]|jgi:RimJ/RimL family protein N-acetyltransferase|nr:GNAT family N-acetyltransferase [Candidatus Kapabacteria bacterium]
MELHGQHIYLRLLTPDDVSEAYVAWMNDSEITQYLESRWTVQTKDTIRAFVQATCDSSKDFLFGMFLNENHKHIGNIKIGNINQVHRFGDVGLIIGDKASWGKGFAAEAIALVTRYGFEELNLHKLFAGMYEQNLGSYKAFIKAGYSDAGRYKQHFFCQGRYVDALWVEKCRD